MTSLVPFILYDHINNIDARVTLEKDRAVVRPWGGWTEHNVGEAVVALKYERIANLVLDMKGIDLIGIATYFGAYCNSLRAYHDVDIRFTGIPYSVVMGCYQWYSDRMYPSVDQALESFQT